MVLRKEDPDDVIAAEGDSPMEALAEVPENHSGRELLMRFITDKKNDIAELDKEIAGFRRRADMRLAKVVVLEDEIEGLDEALAALGGPLPE